MYAERSLCLSEPQRLPPVGVPGGRRQLGDLWRRLLSTPFATSRHQEQMHTGFDSETFDTKDRHNGNSGVRLDFHSGAGRIPITAQ